jgi:hypothetical protein
MATTIDEQALEGLRRAGGKVIWDECNVSIFPYGQEMLRVCCTLMARLASKTPQFSNPLEVWDAEKLRDRILEVGIVKTIASLNGGRDER